MIRRILLSLLLAIGVVSAVTGQVADKKLVSGPQKGTYLPGPCEVFNINGTKHKDRFHCLVCDYSFDPVVMVFARESKGADNVALDSLMRRLDASLEQNADSNLRAFTVILSPDFRSSATGEGAQDRQKIIDETLKRDQLLERLRNRASKLKSLILACTVAEGPKSYNLDPGAEVTVVFYKELKVLENYSYAPAKMTEEDVDMIIDKVEKTLKDAMKRPTNKK
jgi:hypothetical protein